MKPRSWLVSIAAFAVSVLPLPAAAAFHFMEIEQVIGGVSGDTSAQAVQLRMRFAGQTVLGGFARLVVRDAAGMNPVVLSTFAEGNPLDGACRNMLLATAGFAARTTPPVDASARDYLMQPIPASYLAAGSLTFEGTTPPIDYWRVSWGGAAYTGPQTVVTANDADGVTSPPFPGPLPSSGAQALRFTPACATPSTTNAAQYALTGSAAVFTNNHFSNYTVTASAPPVPVLPGFARWVLLVALGAVAASIAIARRRLA